MEPIGKFYSDKKFLVDLLLDKSVLISIEMILSQFSVDGASRTLSFSHAGARIVLRMIH